jgi:prevent-host-death family protein
MESIMTATMTVGVREFRQKLGHYLAFVGEGGAIAISSRGKTVAELRPPEDKPKRPPPRFGGLKGKIWMADDWDEWDDDFYAALEAPIDPPPPAK